MKRGLVVFFFLLSIYANAQWVEIRNDSAWYYGVNFLNKDSGYVVGTIIVPSYDGIIVRTTDGGQTWDTTIFSGWGRMMNISLPSEYVAYSGGQDGTVYRTSDFGNSWNRLNDTPSMDDLLDMYFINNDTGFAINSNGFIYRTANGSVSWTTVQQADGAHNDFPNTGKFQFVNDTLGYVAAGTHGMVRKTTDGGISWQNIPVGNDSMKINSIYMFNADTGIVVGDTGKITRTFDGGETWEPVRRITSLLNQDLLDVVFFTDSIGYAVGGKTYFNPVSYGLIFKTIDKGATWILTDSICCNEITSICKANDSIGYAVTFEGRILKITNANVVDISNVQYNKPSFAVYPNPSTSNSTITITYPSTSSQKEIIINDINGKEITRYALPQWSSTQTIKLPQMARGIYAVRLVGENVAVQKLVVE
jgi:photosystem II stability/assembly factor-like uncharacterized protein